LGIGTPGLVNRGLLIGSLVDRGERDRSASEITFDLEDRLRPIAGITAEAYEPSSLGRGFTGASVDIRILGPDLETLSRLGKELESRIEELPGYGPTNVDIYLNKPQFDVSIDRDRASDLGLSVRDIARTLQILLGGRDLSTFKLDGETYDVVAQLGRGERNDPRDLLELFVRSPHAGLVSLSGVVDVIETTAPRAINHYDRQRNVRFTVRPKAVSQGEAIDTAAMIAQELLPAEGGYAVRVAGESETFVESGNALLFAYGLALVIVYLVLAAQFESFVHPITILVAVALSFTGALLTIYGWGCLEGGLGSLFTQRSGCGRDVTLNIYSKIGLVMLVGLVTKNSILIVEFANQLRAYGRELVPAAIDAARTRFRPILMTALATMVGILPVALGRGSGGDARAPLGIAVVGGMFFSTLLTFFVVPATYIVIERVRERVRSRPGREPAPVPVSGGS